MPAFRFAPLGLDQYGFYRIGDLAGTHSASHADAAGSRGVGRNFCRDVPVALDVADLRPQGGTQRSRQGDVGGDARHVAVLWPGNCPVRDGSMAPIDCGHAAIGGHHGRNAGYQGPGNPSQSGPMPFPAVCGIHDRHRGIHPGCSDYCDGLLDPGPADGPDRPQICWVRGRSISNSRGTRRNRW